MELFLQCATSSFRRTTGRPGMTIGGEGHHGIMVSFRRIKSRDERRDLGRMKVKSCCLWQHLSEHDDPSDRQRTDATPEGRKRKQIEVWRNVDDWESRTSRNCNARRSNRRCRVARVKISTSCNFPWPFASQIMWRGRQQRQRRLPVVDHGIMELHDAYSGRHFPETLGCHWASSELWNPLEPCGCACSLRTRDTRRKAEVLDAFWEQR